MCALLALAVPPLTLSAAPALPGPDRLPADTWILVNWHGVANATQVRDTNPVMKLWNDPQFASARDKIITRIAGPVGKDAAGDRRAVVDDVLSVFENPAVFGMAGDPLADGKDTVHFFVALNHKGKEAEWARLKDREKPGPNAQVSSYAFHGVQIRKTVKTTLPTVKAPTAPAAPGATPEPPKPKVSTTFEATSGDYELYSDNQTVMEALITRLQGDASGDSLLKNAAYQRAQRFRATGPLLEAFVKIPDLSRIPIPPLPQINMAAVVHELHPERMQGLWLSAGMARDRMLVRGALIGDTAPGSVLDLIGNNVAAFQTTAAAPLGDSYGAFRLDLSALYATVLRAVKAGMPPDRAAATSMMIDSMVMAQTGMRAADVLALFSGEIAVASTGDEKPGLDTLPAALMLPITNGDQVLGILRKLAGPLFANEEKISAATVVHVDLPGAPAAAGAAKANTSFFVAISPKLLVLSPDRTKLEGVLSRDASGAPAPAGSVASDSKFLAARKSFPAQLNGISFSDVSRMHWEPFVESLQQKLAKDRQQAMDRAAAIEKGDEKNPADPARAAQLRKTAEDTSEFSQILLDLLPLMKKHLHISAGGSWKASDGMFYDSYLN
jgi:hypothetical protein